MRTLIFCICFILFSVQSFFGQNSYSWQGHSISFSSPEQLQVKSNNEQDFKATGNKITVSLSVAGGMEGISGLEGSLQSYVESFYQKSLSAGDISNQGSNLLGATVMAENMNTRYLVGLFCQTNFTNHFICEIAYLKGNEQLANEVMTSLRSGYVPANKTADKQDNTNKNQGNAGIDKGQNSSIGKDQMKELPVRPGTIPDKKKQEEVWNKQKIVLYGNPECGNTIYTRDMLDKENIEYSFFNVIDNEINENEMYSYLRKYGFMYKIVYPAGYFDSSFYNKLDESWVSSIVDCFKAGQKVVIIGDGSDISRNLKASLDKTKIDYEYMDKSEIDNCEAEIIKGITSVNQVWYPVTVINDTLVINGSHNFTEDIIAIARSTGSSIVDPEKRKQDGNQPKLVENGEPKEMEGMLERHNYWRSKVGVAPLVWSSQLASYAQKWADELKKQDCDLIHSSGSTFGENLFGGSGTTFSAQDAVDAWASELDVFVYEPFTGRRGDGHYTQMVWENTTKVGCAKATCPGGKEVWVCEYSPSGNYINEYPYKKKK